jgi:N-acetylglucosaminyldiphosphoundecaprenol N-acetyl-beta-D-mannosaminyltransferase
MRHPNEAPSGAERKGSKLASQQGGPSLKEIPADADAAALLPDDLSREVYCVLGMAIDAVDMRTVLRRIRLAAAGDVPFLVSTPNLSFLAGSLRDENFRDSLTVSDLCTADGAPIVWIARLLGIPLKERVAGSDMFDCLASAPAARPLPVFFFGGGEGAADAACRRANLQCGVRGVGALYPGYAGLEDLSDDRFVDAINASNAQFLVVALGAAKGQAWLTRNHHRLRVPVRAHLGATVNFQAGGLKRAPSFARRAGLEWLWRIKEEPHLWRRYWADGWVLLRLLLTRVLPLAFNSWRHRLQYGDSCPFRIETVQGDPFVVLRLMGHATAQNIGRAIVHFRNGVNLSKNRLVVDLSRLDFVDARFLGLLLMVSKQLKARGTALQLIGASPRIETLFRLNELGYLLSRDAEEGIAAGCGEPIPT